MTSSVSLQYPVVC